MNRHTYSIVDACQTLNSYFRNREPGMRLDEALDIMEFLAWRVTVGWEQPTQVYDSAVRSLACAALMDGSRYLKPMRELETLADSVADKEEN